MNKLLLPATAIAAIALGLASPSTADAQTPGSRPIVIPSIAAQSINPNPIIAPGLTLGQYAYNTSVIGRALSRVPPYALGYNPYPPVVNYGPVYRNYGNPYLANAYVNPYVAAQVNSYPSYLSGSPYYP